MHYHTKVFCTEKIFPDSLQQAYFSMYLPFASAWLDALSKVSGFTKGISWKITPVWKCHAHCTMGKIFDLYFGLLNYFRYLFNRKFSWKYDKFCHQSSVKLCSFVVSNIRLRGDMDCSPVCRAFKVTARSKAINSIYPILAVVITTSDTTPRLSL